MTRVKTTIRNTVLYSHSALVQTHVNKRRINKWVTSYNQPEIAKIAI